MLILGFFSLCQSIFLPGYLAKRCLRIETNSWLQTIIYVFALSLLANYLLVSSLYFAGLYKPIVFQLLLAAEWLILFWIIQQDRKTDTATTTPTNSEPHVSTGGEHKDTEEMAPRALLIPAIALLIWFTYLFVKSFGSSFTHGDDFGLWDQWAMEWARSAQHSLTYEYPQLIPCNWSISYLLLQNTDVKMFAKSFMPLFSIATLVTFLDLFNQTRERKWLWGLIFYGLTLRYFYDARFLVSGYADVPSAFFAFLAYYATAQVHFQRAPHKFLNYLLPLIFASAAALTKQGGLYILCWVFVWLVVQLRKNFRQNWLVKTGQSSLLAVALNACYPYQHWRIICGQDDSNVGYLYKLIPVPLQNRLSHSVHLLQSMHTGESLVAGATTITLLGFSLSDKQARLVFFTLFLPIYVGWAIGFSYETRTLGIALPFLAMCLGCGAAAAVDFPQYCARQPQSWLKIFAQKRAIQITILLACVITAVGLQAPLFDTTSWTRNVINEWALPFLFSVAAVMLFKLPGNEHKSSSLRPRLSSDCALAPVRLSRVSPAALFISLAIVLIILFGLQNSALTNDVIIAQQLGERKLIGDAPLNKQLYQSFESDRLKGFVVTCYSPLSGLPEISKYYKPYYGDFRNVERQDLENNLRITKASYVLMPSASFSAETQKWMIDSGFNTVFKFGEWSLIEYPGGNVSEQRPTP